MLIELLLVLELQCPRPKVIQYYPPRSNVEKAIRTAIKTCAADGMCLSSIREDRPNVFMAMCKRPEVKK